MVAFRFQIEGREKHIPGQYYELCIKDQSGVPHIRSYSIASSPDDESIEFGVQMLPGGKVSSHLSRMKIGEQIEVRGPLGTHFLWQPSKQLVLVAGGSGVVPFISILGHELTRNADHRAIHLFASAKTENTIPYLQEIREIEKQRSSFHFHPTLTRNTSSDWKGNIGRIDESFLKTHIDPTVPTKVYLCGNSSFVESLSQKLASLLPQAIIRKEYFN